MGSEDLSYFTRVSMSVIVATSRNHALLNSVTAVVD